MLFTTVTLAFMASFFSIGVALPSPEIMAPQPDRVETRATPTTGLTGVVSASSAHGEYFGNITVNGVSISVMFDTGSGPFKWSYGSGVVSGNITYGNVTVGGLTVQNTIYGVATSWASSYDAYDGILGLRPTATSFGYSGSWLSSIVSQLKQPIYGVNLVPASTSTFTFGYQDTAHEASLPVYKPTSVLKTWNLNVTSFGVPSASDKQANCEADTGTTNLYVPLSVAQAYYAKVAGATTADNKRWTWPCGSFVPDLNITIGGTLFRIKGQYNYYTNTPAFGTCGSRLQASSGCILGQPFFYSQYAVFNYANNSVGLTGRV